jgi:hypothetical protein
LLIEDEDAGHNFGKQISMCQFQYIFQGVALCDYSTLSLFLSFEELSADGVPQFEAVDGVVVPVLEVFDAELHDIIDVVVKQMVAVFSQLEEDLVDFVVRVFAEQTEQDLHCFVAVALCLQHLF